MLDYKGITKSPVISKVELERNKRFTKNLRDLILSYKQQKAAGGGRNRPRETFSRIRSH